MACATAPDRMNHTLLTVDVENRGWHDEGAYLGTTTGLYGGKGRSFYLFDSTAVYGCGSDGQKRDLIFNLSEMGIMSSEFQLCELPDGRFAVLTAATNQISERSYELVVISPGSDDRIVLKMLCLAARPSVARAVSDFNKKNSGYRIELTECFPYEENVSNEDWNNAILNLNTQIIAGDMPDIVDMWGLYPEIYNKKGLLENLYTYIDEDAEIKLNDYYENVFDVLTVDGKLPFITNGVAIYTMMADKSVVGDNSGWTMSELKALMESQGVYSIGNMNGSHFMSVVLQTSDSFIDWTAGKCYFDGPEFIELMELAAIIQESSNFAGDDLSTNCIAHFDFVPTAYQVARYRNLYEGNLNIIGFPDDRGEHHAIYTEAKIGISSTSSHKDGAWDFVRTFLTEEQQEACELLPIHKGAFATVMQAAVDGKSQWTTMFENKVTTEDVKITEELLKSTLYTVNDNTILDKIIFEEAQEFFSGQKTAKDAAENIQSRVSLYMSEQM